MNVKKTIVNYIGFQICRYVSICFHFHPLGYSVAAQRKKSVDEQIIDTLKYLALK